MNACGALGGTCDLCVIQPPHPPTCVHAPEGEKTTAPTGGVESATSVVTQRSSSRCHKRMRLMREGGGVRWRQRSYIVQVPQPGEATVNSNEGG